MTLQHLDTVIAFAAVMLGASLLITVATQATVSLLGLRGTNLRRSLVDLFETACTDRGAKGYANEIARRVLRHPLISDSVFSRFCIGADKLPFISAEAAAKLQWAASGIPFRPWLVGALGGMFLVPLALLIIERLSSLAVCEYSDLLASYVPVLNLCKHPWGSGAILGAVFVGLLSRWRLATSIRFEELVAALGKLSEPPSGTLPDPAQCAMLVIAGEVQQESSPKVRAASARVERLFVQEPPESDEGGIAVAVEKAVAQTPAQTETRPEGLRSWFDHAMERASQRFTLQTRVITVVLSLVFIFAAHLDAIRLFQTLSSDAELRAQLVSSADAMTKQAEQILRAREGAGLQARKEGARSVVPDVYHKAMAVVLQPIPTITEQPKPKPRPVPRNVAPPSPSSSQPPPGGGPAMPDDVGDAPSELQAAQGGGQAEPPAARATPEAPAKKVEIKAATPPKPKIPTREKDKPTAAAAPREDKTRIETRARAAKALQNTRSFASREDAVLWLRTALDGDPALENLVAAYEQEVNGELATDADKLIDHSASLRRELARSQFQLLPEIWPGWRPTRHELPGLLVAVAFLSLGAPFWYNMLKKLASLRPLLAMKQNQENKQSKPT